MKKILAIILAFALLVGGIYYSAPEAKEVKAETTEETEKIEYTTEEYTDKVEVNAYLNDNEAPISKTNSDWLFAGWFTDKYCTTQVTEVSDDITTYHAKFVDPGVLNVKLQITEGATPESDSVNMRLVTTVDSLDYTQVGFEVYYGTEAIQSKTFTEDVEITTVYERIVASSQSGVDYNYSPKVVDTDSQYFATATLVNIAKANFENPFYIKPYWVTYNGVRVYGTSRYVTVMDDAFSTVATVNIPVEIAASETYTVTDASDDNSVAVTNTVAYHDGTYAHLRVANTALTSSLTKLNVSNGTDSAVAYHRNLETTYAPSGTAYDATAADKTWYTACDDTETEYVIATTADLYALPDIVNTNGETFAGKTIYVVADIVANKGTATVNGWSVASEDGTGYYWSPIGNATTQFQGEFDGCNHVIEGIYTNGAIEYCGLFGFVKDSTIRNLQLQNSILKTSTNKTVTAVYAGSIFAKGDGNLDNIHSSANVSSNYYQFGGLIGIVDRVDSNDKTGAVCTINDCWYSGNIYSRYYATTTGNKNVRAGGIVAYITRGSFTINNTLFSGNINFSSDTRTGTYRYIGGLVADSNAPSTVSGIAISNSISAGTITLQEGTTYTHVGSVAGRANNKAISLEKVYTTTECYGEIYGSGGLLADDSELPIQIPQNNLMGLSAYHKINLDFVNDWAPMENAMMVPRALTDDGYVISSEGEIKADTSWYTAENGKTEYEIADAGELYGLAILVNDGNTFEGITLELTADIDLNPDWDGTFKIVDGGPVAPDEPTNEWIPIGTSNNPFKGSFNGNQNTIRGLYIDKRLADNNGVGLFGNTRNADDTAHRCSISNLALKNSYIYANNTDYVGGIVGSGEGNISNIYSEVGIYGVNNCNNGGIIGFVPHLAADPYVCTISHCWYDGLLVARTGGSSGDQYVNMGGLLGCAMGGDTIVEHCLFTGTINYKTGFAGNSNYENYPVWPRVGGLIGRNNGTTSAVAIVDSLSAGNMTLIASGENATISQVGSIMGSERGTTSNSSTALRVSNVYTMSNYNLPIAMSKESSGVTVDVTSFVDLTGAATTITEVANWDGVIGNLDSTYWAPTTTIPVLKSLVGYTNNKWAVLP